MPSTHEKVSDPRDGEERRACLGPEGCWKRMSSFRRRLTRGREAQSRPCHLEAKRLKEATDSMDRYRRFWAGSFGRMDELVKELEEKETIP